VDEVDYAIRDMSVVKCGGCKWRRPALVLSPIDGRDRLGWACRNLQCTSYGLAVRKDDHECCGWWEPRMLLRRIADR
jgi:hypothetical protein